MGHPVFLQDLFLHANEQKWHQLFLSFIPSVTVFTSSTVIVNHPPGLGRHAMM